MDQRLKAFLDGPVMLVAAVAAPHGGAAIARVMGVRPGRDDRSVDVFVSGGQWRAAIEALAPGQILALTLCRPSTYETMQVKGPVQSVAQAGADGLEWARAYAAHTADHLGALGVQDAQMRPWLRTDDLVQVTFTPQAAYQQTPGPQAGQPMPAAE